MSQYLQGSIIISDVVFRDAETKTAVDPDTVTFFYQVEGMEPSTLLTYAGATVPSVGVIARLGTRRYRTYIDTSGFVGDGWEFWNGHGAWQAPGQRKFTVIALGGF